MILESLLDFGAGLVTFFLGLLPSTAPPAWLTDANGMLADIWTSGAGLGAWIPWGLVGTVFAAVLACMVVGFGIKVVRIVASFLTAGGGSAA